LEIDSTGFFFGVGDAGAPAAAAVAAPVVEAVVEKTSFDVKIGAVDAKAKIKIIKEVRVITGLGLKEVCLVGSNRYARMFE
jgi:large subunit ribosomal protein L7/L12